MGLRLRRHHYTLVAAIVLTVACVAAGCGSSSDVNVTAPSGTRCAITVSGAAAMIPAAGGSGTLAVNTERECAWSARVESPWISLNTGQGQGPATLTYSVQPNPAGAERRGNVLVDEQRFEVRQEAVPCRYDLTPSAVELPVDGGTVEVSLAAPAACPWTAQRSEPWVGVQPTEGSGALRIGIVLGRNPGATRTASVTIAGSVVSVRQLGTSGPVDPCRNEISPTRRATPAGGEMLTVTIAAASVACAWTVSSDVPWIWILDVDKGVGNGTVRLQVQVNTGAARTGTVRLAGQILTVDQEAATVAACSYAIVPASRSVGAPGADVPVEVRTTPACAWTASSNASWITVASGGSGSGNGSVRLLVAANAGAARSGTALIAGQSFTVEQAAAATCSYTILPTSRNVGAPGDDFTVEVRTTAGCAWTASSSASWIGVASGGSGSGNGAVRLAVAANTGPARTGTVTIAGQFFSVEQAAAPAPCAYTIAPTLRSVGARADEVTVEVRTAAGCAWTASSNASWMTVASGGSGAGDGSVRLAVAANPGAIRTGTALIAGQAFTVEQAAAAPCTYRVKPDRYNAGRSADDVRIAVDTTSVCPWTAASPVPWATIAEGASGIGQGTVRVLVSANAGEPRSATLIIAGEAFRLSQEGQCPATIKPEYYNSGPGPDDFKISVKTESGCAWTASSPVPWATIIEGAAGSGNGDVRIRVEPNPGPARSATLVIAGVPFALAQEARK